MSSLERKAGTGPVSIHDVAAAAEVSIATVSRVMNNLPGVAPDTAARVRKVIERLGYSPNPLAKVLGSGETRVLGLALPRFHGEFMSWLLHGADEEATRLGYHLMMTTITKRDGRDVVGDAPERPGQPAVSQIRGPIVGSKLIDAMAVVITEATDPLIDQVVRTGIPTVVIDTDLSDRGLDSVVLDNDKGTVEAVDHLLRWVEPQKLHFVGGPRGNFDTQRRAAAFSAALAGRGCAVDPEQIAMGDYSVDWGKEWAVRMLQKKALEGGVLAANDKIALGIMRVAEEARIWVPDQLRVVGFNDSELSRVVRPRLSTVALPMHEMGAMAVRMLVRRIEDRTAPARCVKLPTRLTVRESSTAMNF
ncbi:MAG TPA: LacI family DNA-binding transcriptional regulator [Phycisphaerales bacterium]|nr:LacI family DNA-binding transcriptional regulator [Phycisphaerales bacterium]